MDLTARDQKKLIILGILAGLAILLIPLALFKPAKFPALPSDAPPPIPSTFETPQLTLPCPVAKEYCDQASPVIYQGKTLGMGFTLPAKTQIKAVFPGTLEQSSQKGGIFRLKSHPILWLHGKGAFEGFVATYNFFASPVALSVKDKLTRVFPQGETIATASDQGFPKEKPYLGVNLIFSVSKNDRLSTPVIFRFK